MRAGTVPRGGWRAAGGERTGPVFARHGRGGFTLVELLVVILIILIISAVALPTVLPAINHRQVSEAARLLQGALAGARDSAIHDNQPNGIRLLPDPTYPITYTATNTINPYEILAYNRFIPLEAAPEYNEGYCTPIPLSNLVLLLTGPANNVQTLSSGVQVSWPSPPSGSTFPPYLVLMENPLDPATLAPHPPTSWFWNIRVGDRIQIHNAGPWYTVVGPMVMGPSAGNSEMFVNLGPPAAIGAQAAPVVNGTPAEYLLLVNGQDDNNNGWVDEGFDGVDNNANGITDEYAEWEKEEWLGALASNTTANVPYTIQRRPAPSANAREIALPTSMVIDATTAFLTQERSRLPVNAYTGFVDIILNPDGTVLPTVIYSSPTSFDMSSAFYHFWLAERQDLADAPAGSTAANAPLLPIASPSGGSTSYTGATLQGEYSLVTLFTRTGQITSNANPPFYYSTVEGYNNQGGTFSINNPFIAAQQGIIGEP